MAHSGARIIPFPVPTGPHDPQLEAFSVREMGAVPNESQNDALRRINRLLAQPDVAVLHFQHELLRLERIKSVLTPEEIARVQMELYAFSETMNRIVQEAQRRLRAQSQAIGLIA